MLPALVAPVRSKVPEKSPPFVNSKVSEALPPIRTFWTVMSAQVLKAPSTTSFSSEVTEEPDERV